MKDMIKHIMDNQGLCLSAFCGNYNFKRYKIEDIFYNNKNNLNNKEIELINNLRLIKPTKIKYSNEILIEHDFLNISKVFPNKTKYGFNIHYKRLGKNHIYLWYQ